MTSHIVGGRHESLLHGGVAVVVAAPVVAVVVVAVAATAVLGRTGGAAEVVHASSAPARPRGRGRRRGRSRGRRRRLMLLLLLLLNEKMMRIFHSIFTVSTYTEKEDINTLFLSRFFCFNFLV